MNWPRSALLVLALSAAATAGSCQGGDDPLLPPLPPPEIDGVKATPLEQLADPPPGQARALVIRYRIVTLKLPIGAASETEDLWTYVNEEPLGARRGPCLARNGVRVGLGREADWPEIAKVLRRLTGLRTSRGNMLAQPGRPVPIILRKGADTQTVFMFRPDGTLFGRDYPPGDNLIVLTAGINFDDPKEVLLAGAPVVRSTARRRRYVKGPTGYVFKNEPVSIRLEELAFQFTVPRGGFVMIGPGPEARRSTSPGRLLLTSEFRGARFETVLVILPEVFAVALRPSPAPPPP